VTVISTAYKGREVEVRARLADGQSLRFLVSAEADAPVPSSGSSIALAWQPTRPLLVPDTQG
jgi:spermidine/putrescine transport system ATP-binding protein